MRRAQVIFWVLLCALMSACKQSPAPEGREVERDKETLEATRAALFSLTAASDVELATDRALLTSTATILAGDLLLLDAVRADREGGMLTSAERALLNQISKTLDGATNQSARDLGTRLQAVVNEGALIADVAGYPWIEDFDPRVLSLSTTEEHPTLVLRGRNLKIDQLHVADQECRLDRATSAQRRYLCPRELGRTIPISPITGKWSVIPITADVSMARSGVFEWLRYPKRIVPVALSSMRAPEFAGSLTVLALHREQNDQEQATTKEFSFQGRPCQSSSTSWRISPNSGEGWVIDPGSITISNVRSVGASSRPILKDVSPEGFTVAALVDAGRCIKAPFGIMKISSPGRLAFTASWKEIKPGVLDVTTDVVRESLLEWGEARQYTLPANASGYTLEFKRSDGTVERVGAEQLAGGHQRPWLQVEPVKDGEALKLSVASVGLHDALGEN